jgi:hypothetical protein
MIKQEIKGYFISVDDVLLMYDEEYTNELIID